MTFRFTLGTLVLLLTAFVFGVRVSSETPSDPGREKTNPGADKTNPEDDSGLVDLLAEESNPSFSYLAPPSELKAPPRQQRNWRFGQAPPNLHPNLKAPARLPLQPSHHPNPNINLDYRLDPYTNKRDNSYGPLTRRRPRPSHNYNPYATVDDSSKNRLHANQRPQPPFSGFQTIIEPPTGSRPFPTHHLGHQRPFEDQNHHRPHTYHEQGVNHDPYGQEHEGERNNEQQGQKIYFAHEKRKEQEDLIQRGHHSYYIPEEQNEGREQQSFPTGFQEGGLEHDGREAQLENKDLTTQFNIHENTEKEQPNTESSATLFDSVNNQELDHQSLGNSQTHNDNIQGKLSNRPTLSDKESLSNADMPSEESNVQADKSDNLNTTANPRNLAAILAGASSIGLKQSKSEEEKMVPNFRRPKERPTIEPTENPTRTRASIPEHIRPTTSDPSGVEYYDELYDEFVDMYYDAEVKQDKNKSLDTVEKVSSQQSKESVTESSRPTPQSDLTKKVQPTETAKTVRMMTTRGITPRPKLSTRRPSLLLTRPTMPPSRKTTKKESAKETTLTPRGNTATISLSEILQELGLGLPQFLGTLKVHGTSLKEFTEKLKAKSLSKSEFRRAKGNVKKLLEILDGTLDRNSKEKESQTEEITTATPTSTKTPKRATTTLLNTKPTENVETATPSRETTEKIDEPEITSAKTPRVFGSRPTGLLFARPNQDRSEEKDSDSSNLDSSSKRPIAIDLDIKGVSADGILQNFKTMFNISEKTGSESQENISGSVTPSTTAKSKTTVSLRPYRTGAERNRPYRPLGYEGGNRNIHRGIINSRHGSTTARPTLRPPYVPRPPSINFGETMEDVDSNILTEDPEDNFAETKEQSSKAQDGTSKKLDSRYNNDVYNYNLVKSNPDSMNVSTRSAIMAAGILGGVALSVFIAIFIVVKYRNHQSRHRRRIPLTLPSDSSTSSFPPLYASRNMYSKECYQTSGFWTTLKKRFDPYSTSSSPTSM